ncbi:MAG TPA: RidA family protein [Burkholderiales bacterium]|nr:RidA family protein [Burkholderiales bacterium]
MKKEILNPPALGAPPRFYSHAVALEGPAKLVYVSGQVSLDQDGKVIGAGNMRAQSEQVFKNLAHVLRAAGAGWDDVIKMNGYMVGLNAGNVAAYREGRASHLKAKRLPASTLVGVTSLVHPELLLEVEVVAAIAPKKKKR